MKNLLVPFVISILTATAHAAITVTVSPGATGTIFSITQTAQNPVFTTEESTVGLVTGFELSARSVVADPALPGVTGSFSVSLGTLSRVGGASASAVALRFMPEVGGSGFLPIVDLDGMIPVPVFSTHQFVFTPGAAGEVAVPFYRFLPGTYTETSAIFGTITTVVIPEPGSAALLVAACAGALSRRRR